MADNAANFTFTSQNKPSIFEIVAQKSLNDTLYPGLQKVALFLHNLSPQKFNWLTKYYDESFLVLTGLLQYHYLKHYDSSFSENFYGLQRAITNDKKITNEQRWASLFFLVGLPYFKRKLDERLTIYKIQKAEGSLKKNFTDRFKNILLVVHSTLELAYGAWTIVNYLKYMSDKNKSQLPILQLLELKLIYVSEPQDLSGFWSALFRGQLGVSELSVGLIKNAVTSSLEVTAFFLQFVQAWNARMSNYNITDLPKVDPPPFDNKAHTYKGKCPLCLQNWKLPAVLPVSGYIFCFSCILSYLREVEQKCPVTNLPVKSSDIVLMYDNE